MSINLVRTLTWSEEDDIEYDIMDGMTVGQDIIDDTLTFADECAFYSYANRTNRMNDAEDWASDYVEYITVLDALEQVYDRRREYSMPDHAYEMMEIYHMTWVISYVNVIDGSELTRAQYDEAYEEIAQDQAFMDWRESLDDEQEQIWLSL